GSLFPSYRWEQLTLRRTHRTPGLEFLRVRISKFSAASRGPESRLRKIPENKVRITAHGMARKSRLGRTDARPISERDGRIRRPRSRTRTATRPDPRAIPEISRSNHVRNRRRNGRRHVSQLFPLARNQRRFLRPLGLPRPGTMGDLWNWTSRSGARKGISPQCRKTLQGIYGNERRAAALIPRLPSLRRRLQQPIPTPQKPASLLKRRART